MDVQIFSGSLNQVLRVLEWMGVDNRFLWPSPGVFYWVLLRGIPRSFIPDFHFTLLNLPDGCTGCVVCCATESVRRFHDMINIIWPSLSTCKREAHSHDIFCMYMHNFTVRKDIKSVFYNDWCHRPPWLSRKISVASLIWSLKDYSFEFAYSDVIIMKP